MSVRRPPRPAPFGASVDEVVELIEASERRLDRALTIALNVQWPDDQVDALSEASAKLRRTFEVFDLVVLEARGVEVERQS
jgi:hypothetical protein